MMSQSRDQVPSLLPPGMVLLGPLGQLGMGFGAPPPMTNPTPVPAPSRFGLGRLDAMTVEVVLVVGLVLVNRFTVLLLHSLAILGRLEE